MSKERVNPTEVRSVTEIGGWDLEADVVVVGCGCAGACAASAAAEAGAEVLGARADIVRLYAAGRTTSGLAKGGYCSGISLGDGTFFGVRAGRSAAQPR